MFRDVAKETGGPLGEAVERFTGQDQFARFATKVQLRHPEIFVRAGVAEDQANSDFYLYLTESLPATLERELAAQPYRTEVRVGETALSTDLRDDIVDAIDDFVATPSVRLASSSLSDDATHLLIRYVPESSIDRRAFAEEAVRLAADKLGLSQLPVDVEFLVEDARLAEEATVKGGYALYNENSGAAVCTSGFTARRSGNLGVVTANHCHPVDYHPTTEVLANPGTAASPAQNGAIDLRFYRTNSPHNTTGWFQWQTGSEQRVLDVINPVAGMAICHYGIASGRRCGTVANETDFCQGGTCGLYRTTTYISGGGDSGGPWYTPGTARGIHTGAYVVNNVNVGSAFTGIGRVSNNLGATLLN